MKKLAFTALSKVINLSDTAFGLKALQRFLNTGIPFNSGHGFTFKRLSQEEALIELPFKRINKNHLGTVHACAIATLAEYPAGLLLIKNFDPADFRVVMLKLEADYHKHAVGTIQSRVKLSSDEANSILEQLESEGLAQAKLTAHITDKNDQLLATITTTWQLKSWQDVRKPSK